MIKRLGYACIALGIDATTNRTTRLQNATPERLRSLIAANLEGLAETLRYNASLRIQLFRLSSAIVPFASHPANTLRWWEEFEAELRRIGHYAIEHEMRLSLHPGQYTVLSSPTRRVTEAAIEDLRYHARLLDAMELGSEHKIVVHGGGTYGSKHTALGRFVSTFHGLPDEIRRRLVVENDERSYSVADVLEINRQTGIPVVFDALHDEILSSPSIGTRSDLVRACAATWGPEDGPAEVHFSSQDCLKRAGAHADWIDLSEFLEFAEAVGTTPVDCMLEAKKKELALLHLRAELGTRATLGDSRLQWIAPNEVATC